MTTDTSERGHERMICSALTGTNDAARDGVILDLVFALVREHGPVGRKDVDLVLLPKLPDRLTRQQKLRKVNNLLQELRRSRRIENCGPRAKPKWVLGGADSERGRP